MCSPLVATACVPRQGFIVATAPNINTSLKQEGHRHPNVGTVATGQRFARLTCCSIQPAHGVRSQRSTCITRLVSGGRSCSGGHGSRSTIRRILRVGVTRATHERPQPHNLVGADSLLAPEPINPTNATGLLTGDAAPTPAGGRVKSSRLFRLRDRVPKERAFSRRGNCRFRINGTSL